MNSQGSKFGFNTVAPPIPYGEVHSETSVNRSFKQADSYIAGTKRKSEKLRNYFDDDEDDNKDQLPVSYSLSNNVDDSDYDPLDAFMAGVQEQVQREESTIGSNNPPPEIVSGQDERDYGPYLASLEKPTINSDGGDVQYDSDGFPLSDTIKKDGEKCRIEPLPTLDHSQISYPPFRKNFYKESNELYLLPEREVLILREELEVSVQGSDVPKPLRSFSMSSLPALLQKEISKVGFEKPTSIQAQALPIALSGRDLIGLAKTGSGKTLAYVWPMIVHVLDQPQMRIGDGPIGIILSPTRELAAQIYSEAKKFAKAFSIRVCAVFGGGGKWEMVKALKEAPEIVVATPGRFIELTRNKSTNLNRCTMVVLDEADRMFEMGFEYQMRSIVNNIRPDRQTLLFSATMKRKVEGFARELLTNPIRIVVGTIGQANPDIRQIVELVENDHAKWLWLAERADEYVADGKVLIFVLSKAGVEEVTAALRRHFTARQLNVGVESLHGDKDQAERTISMRKFSKSQETAILVATDIASRGLDVKDIRTVINYDVAKNIETYVHRIGRTGRMGLDGVVPGTAYTLITPADGSFAVDLVQNLNLSSQKVPSELQKLAENDPKWARIRHISAGGGRGVVSGKNASSFNPSASRGGGIGYAVGNRLTAKAMTSSMLAESSSINGSGVVRNNSSQMTFKKAMGGTVISSSADISVFTAIGGVIPGNIAANPYIQGQGMGRGKHLTKPSWSDSNGNNGGALSSHSLPGSSPSEQYEDAAVNRTNIPQINFPDLAERKNSHFLELPSPAVFTMPGVIESTVTGSTSSVTETNTISTYGTNVPETLLVLGSVPKKKSRWDT